MEREVPQFQRVLQNVEKLGSLEPFSVTIKCWSQDTKTFTDLIISKVYPFTTINELKLRIYDNKASNVWIPDQVFLATTYGNSTESEKDFYLPSDNQWFSQEDRGSGTEYIILKSPLFRCRPGSPLDTQFIDTLGEQRAVARDNRGRSVLEEAYPGQIPTFFAFCATDMLAAFGFYDGQVVPDRDWIGRFKMYFPALEPNNYRPSAKNITDASQLLKYMIANNKILDAVQDLLENDVPTVNLSVSNILALRLDFIREAENDLTENSYITPFKSVEELFFDADVNGRRPFMRLLSALDEPITKIHVQGLIPIPDIAHPSLLLQWKDEQSPDPHTDFLFMKVLTKGIETGSPPLYATVKIFYDGSAFVTLLPSKQHRNGIDPKTDLRDLDLILAEGVKKTHLEGRTISLNEVSLTLGLRLEREDKHLTSKILSERLKHFSYFFQEIKNYNPETKPLILLRYKAVNQYADDPNNIYTFIRQYIQFHSMKSNVIPAIASEFNLTFEEAERMLRLYAELDDSYILVNPELHTFSKENNSGIDIAIFGQHPVYNIKITRCTSIKHLQRIYSILSMYLTTDITTVAKEDVEQAIKKMEPAITKIEQLRIEKEDDEYETKTIINKIIPPAAAQPSDLDLYGLNSSGSDMGAVPAPSTAKKSYNNDFAMYLNDDFSGGAVAPPHPLSIYSGGAVAPPHPHLQTNSQQGGAKRVFKEDEDKDLVAAGWYIKKLKELDPRLFEFKAGIKGDNDYSRKCQSNANRQPVGLSEQEYKRMLKEYENDRDLTFIEIPLRPGESDPPMIGEVITVLRYGTTPTAPNYYFCPLLFCLKDKIMVLTKDFEGSRWRKGYEKPEPKKPNTCPFCGGQEIIDKKAAKIGYTVMRRGFLPQSTSTVATFIDFTKDSTHPDKFELPCCYDKSTMYRLTDKAFAPFLALTRKTQPEDQQIAEVALPDQDDIINYEIYRFKLPSSYILEPSRFPLKPGTFGLIGPALDKYFQQNSPSLVKRDIRQELRPSKGNHGFLRMGVQGSKTLDPNALFGILAPYLNKNSIDEVRQLILDRMSPRLFISANYGNLVHEFYNPCGARPSSEELQQWSSTYLNMTPNPQNEFELRRAYMSYNSFIEYISSNTTYKEYRIFAHMLSYKGIFSENGIIFIMIEYDSQDLEKAPRVACPPFGYNPLIHDGCDFGFILRDQQNIYEALLYYEFIEADEQFTDRRHVTYLKFNPKTGAKLEPIILQRINEFMNSCEYVGRAIYTAGSSVKAKDLVTVSELMAPESPIKDYVKGIVRDVYNHIVGVTLFTGTGRLIPMPVADDGYLPLESYFYFDWNSVPVTTVDRIIDFYNNELGQFIEDNPGYKISAILKMEGSKQVRAIRFANGAICPARGIIANLPAELQSMIIASDFPEYEMNRAIFFSEDADEECEAYTSQMTELPEDLAAISGQQLAELYQHFRLSVAHWLAETATASLRRDVENVIFRRGLPTYERRRRLMILLHATLDKWFIASADYIPGRPFIKRRDCRRLAEEACTDACAWSEPDKTCKIHVPLKTPTFVLTKDLFIMRLIDELIQFRQRRNEILEDRVKTTVQLKTAVRIEDEWILPESSISWIELLKLEWAKKTYEVPKYYEEIIQPSDEVGKEDRLRPEEMYGISEEFLEHFDTTSDKWALTSEETLRKVLQTQEIINPASISKNLFSPVFFIAEDLRVMLYLPDISSIKNIPPVYAIVQQDGSFGLLISNRDPSNPKIAFNELPAKLQAVINNRRLLKIVGSEAEEAAPVTLRRRRTAIPL